VATHWTGRTVGESEGFEPRLIGYGLRRHDAMLQWAQRVPGYASVQPGKLQERRQHPCQL